LLDGDRFLLCSDGLSHYFEEEIEMLAELLSIHDLDAATQTMIDAANEAGGGDNITAITISIRAEGKGDLLRAQTLQLKHDFLSQMPLFNQLNERELLHVPPSHRSRLLQERTNHH
jgi:serine/threonine protein phosphatase PrpC